MFDLSRVTVYSKKRKKKIKVKTRVQRYAERLEKNLPKSEQWFRNKWQGLFEADSLDIFNDQYNVVLGTKIPDVINKGYKYIIEIDGSIHNTPKQKLNDIKKDLYYKQRGYVVFRVKAYDEDSFNLTLEAIKEIRKTKPELVNKKIRR